jgi:serine/threonine protein kinase
MRYQPGQTLAAGRYTIRRSLAQGGMGAVYLATDHQTFDRPVVIKAMRAYIDATDPHEASAARRRFMEEARTLASLRHPTIPQIYAYFQEGPHSFIVMEYIEGANLQQELTSIDEATGQPVPGRASPVTQVIRWGIQLCRVLEYLADQQPHPVTHHDIKPANVLIDALTGDVRLVDFGAAQARLLHPAGVGGENQPAPSYGTPGYAPPEQYRGMGEPRSDVYALAATLYHLVTDDDPGLHPFRFPHLDRLDALGRVLHGALDHKITRRPTAATLGQQLEALLTQSEVEIPAPTQAPLWRKLWWRHAQRPIAITIICALGFIGDLAAVPLLFSPIAQQVGAWYQPYLLFSIVIGLTCTIGLWRMKKWAAYLYLALLALNQALLLATGAWYIAMLVFPGIVTFFVLRYMNDMS